MERVLVGIVFVGFLEPDTFWKQRLPSSRNGTSRLNILLCLSNVWQCIAQKEISHSTRKQRPCYYTKEFIEHPAADFFPQRFVAGLNKIIQGSFNYQ
ncbi:MAG: hypothetical protein CV080_01940 [Candidatus Kuenenia stuttgartiensis]|jgi:hypothetical protein|nr:MAG: hypothetical protein CV080_01940 [Candidatus Kuenenia stuttgartiensis]